MLKAALFTALESLKPGRVSASHCLHDDSRLSSALVSAAYQRASDGSFGRGDVPEAHKRLSRLGLEENRELVVLVHIGCHLAEDMHVGERPQVPRHLVGVDACLCGNSFSVKRAIFEQVGHVCLTGNQQGRMIVELPTLSAAEEGLGR